MRTSTFWLSHVNRIVAAAEVTGTGTPITDVANIRDGDPSTVYRSDQGTTVEGAQLQTNWGGGNTEKIGVVALLHTNLSLADSVTFTLFDGTLLTPIVSATVKAHTDPELGYPVNFIWALPEDLDVGRITAEIHEGDSPASDILDIGEWWAGPCLRPEHGVSFQVQPSVQDPSEVSYSRGQQAYVNERRPYRMVQLVFPALYESEVFGRFGSEAVNLYDVFFLNGARKRVLTGLVGDTDPYTDEQGFLVNRMAVYGLMQGELRPQPYNRAVDDDGTYERVYSASVVIRETL